ncbi:ATP-binding protein [Paenibacillus hexagrammi]|uniref:histidine kinase n=2 Tax=Paenibacillus hexagrammi TaxID=2908839 RepID=A0ABY3SU21_9BACL|nr:ATP-binding protein [Paenibacillus sp. YPD9-1]
MPAGGDIRIELVQQDGMVEVHITDQGGGMPEASIHRLGEPFYTTKESGNGLGLMVSFKIVEQHNGSINIHSQQGVGTVFRVSFPAFDQNR